MNFMLIVLIILGGALTWVLLATEFDDIGDIVGKILKNIDNAIHHND